MVANAVILVTISETSTWHSPATILLSNLALTDLSLRLLAQPFSLLNTLAIARRCVIFTVSATDIDRLVALEYHLRYHTLVTPKIISLLTAAIWLVSGFVSSMWLWSKDIFYPGITVIIALCPISSFIVYCKVYRIVRRHQVQIHSQMQHFPASIHVSPLAEVTTATPPPPSNP